MSCNVHVFPRGGPENPICKRGCGTKLSDLKRSDPRIMEGRPLRTDPTERQMEILGFMREYQASNGAPPSLREICDKFEISSTNGVSDHLKSLERKGLVRRYAGRTRNWVPIP